MAEEADQISGDAVTAWVRLVRVSQALLSKVEAELKAAGHPPLVWYDVLLELNRVGTDGLRPYQLQERMLLAQYNLSRLIDRLIRAGYVARRDCADDRRGQILEITAEGRDCLRAMWPAYRKALRTHFAAKLEPSEVTALASMLKKLG